MLAAALPDFDRGLQTVKLAFMLASKDLKTPLALREYLFSVIGETLELLKSPDRFGAIARPESISLAIKVSTSPELCGVLEEIARTHDVSTGAATIALNELEATTDSAAQLAHSGFSVHATF